MNNRTGKLHKEEFAKAYGWECLMEHKMTASTLRGHLNVLQSYVGGVERLKTDRAAPFPRMDSLVAAEGADRFASADHVHKRQGDGSAGKFAGDGVS